MLYSYVGFTLRHKRSNDSILRNYSEKDQSYIEIKIHTHTLFCQENILSD